MEYSLWLDGKWTPIERQAVEDRGRSATFRDIDVMFFDTYIFDPLFPGHHEIAAFVVNADGDRLYALKKSVIKHEYNTPRFRYLILPADFLNTEQTLLIERSLGNPLALQIGN